LIFHRFKTKVSEIDLIFEKEEQILLVEVKKLTQPWRSFQRISSNQQLKLKANNLLFSLNFKDKKTRSYVAWVNQKNIVTFCSIE
jgi:Holliday junction resolvase-like predicted endonuclease